MPRRHAAMVRNGWRVIPLASFALTALFGCGGADYRFHAFQALESELPPSTLFEIWSRELRAGRFNVEVRLDGSLVQADANSTHTLLLYALSENETRAALDTDREYGSPASSEPVSLVVTTAEPTAVLPRSADIWNMWLQAKAVAMEAVFAPPPAWSTDNEISRRKLLSLDPSRWRSDTIRLVITPRGLELDSIPANPPE